MQAGRPSGKTVDYRQLSLRRNHHTVASVLRLQADLGPMTAKAGQFRSQVFDDGATTIQYVVRMQE